MTTLNLLSMVCLDSYLLLAGQSQYVHMGRRFRRRGGGVEWTELLLPLALIACIIGFGWLVSRYVKFREQRNAESPQVLFTQLCQAHGLDWTSQQLLRAIASAHRLPTPAQLFVEPDKFDVDRLGASFENRRQQVVALHAKLFGRSAGSAKSEPC